mgnify:CR=1 FL=1
MKKNRHICLFYFDNNTNKVHISYDLDFIDPNDAPGVSIPEVNGPTKETALALAKEITKYKAIGDRPQLMK